MNTDVKAFMLREGGKLASDVLRVVMARPHKPKSPLETTEEITPAETFIRQLPPPTPTLTRTQSEELDYRWECCMKHLGGASILLREAYERAIDEGMGEGTAEKMMEAMNEHSGMESDLEKMLPIPEAKAQAEKLLSGVRAFRKAAWEANITRGGGTKEDIGDAKMWNDILYQEAFSSAKSQPGTECIEEGM